MTKRFKRQPSLAVDHYLRWGFRQKLDTVLIGGNENDNSTNIEILAFKGGRLISSQENNLKPRIHNDFANQLDLVLSDITREYRGFALVVATPISSLDYPCARLCRTIGDEPFRRRISISIEYGEKKSNMQRYSLPAGIATASILVYAALIAYTWNIYNDAITEYRSVNEGVNGFDESMLRILEARRGFLAAPLPQTATVNNARRLAAAIARVDHVQVRKLFVRNADTGNSTYMELSPDATFGVVAETPEINDSTGLEQARPILDQLAASTGSKLRLIRQDVTTDAESGQKRLIMTFEGN